MPGTSRMGATETNGLLGAKTTASADVSASRTPGVAWQARFRKWKPRTGSEGAAADEVVPESERVVLRDDAEVAGAPAEVQPRPRAAAS
ncbi:MAG: hypothetical protein R3B59_09320 [Dehalococcoidia bacterium]